MLIHFMAIWNTLLPFGILYDHLAHCVFICTFFHKNLATPLQCTRLPKHSRHLNIRRNGRLQSAKLFFLSEFNQISLPSFCKATFETSFSNFFAS
jgi:hypothetical protein